MGERAYHYWILPVPIAATPISPTAKLLFARLLNWWGTTGEAFGSVRILARELNCSIGAVLRATKELERAELVTIDRQSAGSTIARNRYAAGPTWLAIESGRDIVGERLQNGSASKTGALPKRERFRNGNQSAPETGAPALPKRERSAPKTVTENYKEKKKELSFRTAARPRGMSESDLAAEVLARFPTPVPTEFIVNLQGLARRDPAQLESRAARAARAAFPDSMSRYRRLLALGADSPPMIAALYHHSLEVSAEMDRRAEEQKLKIAAG